MLTKSQKKTYDFIKNYLDSNELAPTLEEIAQGIGLRSKGTVSRYVNALIAKGLLKKSKEYGASRRLCLAEEPSPSPLKLPLLGSIAAGQPIEAISNAEYVEINQFFYGDSLYMLKVKGDSMIEEGIFDGDFVVCDKRDTASNGEIVVALVDAQEATLKRIYWHEPGKVMLCPANSEMSPMEYDAERVVVQGVLRCQLRQY